MVASSHPGTDLKPFKVFFCNWTELPHCGGTQVREVTWDILSMWPVSLLVTSDSSLGVMLEGGCSGWQSHRGDWKLTEPKDPSSVLHWRSWPLALVTVCTAFYGLRWGFGVSVCTAFYGLRCGFGFCFPFSPFCPLLPTVLGLWLWGSDLTLAYRFGGCKSILPGRRWWEFLVSRSPRGGNICKGFAS